MDRKELTKQELAELKIICTMLDHNLEPQIIIRAKDRLDKVINQIDKRN
ncbi:MAG: hypothetical protein ACTSSK_03615 [Candidatus Heimdallarchaeota archaeon]